MPALKLQAAAAHQLFSAVTAWQPSIKQQLLGLLSTIMMTALRSHLPAIPIKHFVILITLNSFKIHKIDYIYAFTCLILLRACHLKYGLLLICEKFGRIVSLLASIFEKA